MDELQWDEIQQICQFCVLNHKFTPCLQYDGGSFDFNSSNLSLLLLASLRSKINFVRIGCARRIISQTGNGKIRFYRRDAS